MCKPKGRTMEVVQMVSKRKPRRPGEEAALRRLAVQLAGQLPENTEEAIRVLDLAKTLVRSFLAEPEPV